MFYELWSLALFGSRGALVVNATGCAASGYGAGGGGGFSRNATGAFGSGAGAPGIAFAIEFRDR